MSHRSKDVVSVFVLAAVYLAAGKLGLSLAYVNASATAVWPPAGVALAALLLWGSRLWPGVFLGAFLVNLLTPGHVLGDFLIAGGNTLEALLGAYWVRRFAHGVHFAGRTRDVFKFALLAGAAATAVSATIGVTSLCLVREAVWLDFPKIWVTWWLGDMMSNLMIAPALLIWSQPLLRTAPAGEALPCFATIITLDLFLFGPPRFAFPAERFKYLTFLPMLWTAVRCGPHGAITCALITAGLALAMTLLNTGPFAGPDPNSALLQLQVYAGALTITGLAVAAIVAERRNSEHALRASEERERARAADLQTIMQSVPAMILIAHDPHCRTITGNPASDEFLRLPPRSNASKSARPDERPINFEVLSQGIVLRSDELPVQRAARGEVIRDFEEEIRFDDGTVSYLLGNASPLRDSNGQVTGAVAAFVDITDRKKAEQALRAREEELGMIINRTPFMLTRCSRELRYRFVSRAYADMIGRPADEIMGRSILEIMGAEGFATIRPHVEEVLQGRRVSYESEIHFQNVGARFLHVAYTPERDEHGQVNGWIASLLDITERKAAETALRAAQAKLAEHAADLEKTVAERTLRLRETVHELQTLSYSIAHDMRAPLRAMSAFSDLLLEEAATLSPEGQEYCRRIVNGANRLDGLIHDALNYTKTVLQELPLEPVNLGVLLRGLIDTYPNFHPAHATIEITGELPAVLGNAGLLTQCFANLLGNAVKFVPAGTQPRVRIWSEQHHTLAIISVQDNGIGIRKEHQTRLFGLFQKLDPSYEGTGIGLAIVRKVVERMHGEVGVESDAGIGSRFWVKLPLAPV